jgi:acetyl esterase/lipase
LCKELRIPIVGIDYSLAPEHPYPRAAQECFYVYAWCLLNKNMLGWTGEKIICLGDSAGGTFATNIVQQAIINSVRIPDALVPVYGSFISSYSISPSKLMAVMDPMLNLGILFRCANAYCGIDFEMNKEKLMYEISQNSSDDDASYTKKKYSITSGLKKPTKKKSSIPELVAYDARLLDDENSNFIFDVDEQTLLQNMRLKNLHNIMGDSAFHFELLKNHPAPQEQLMSPIYSPDNVLAKFPPTCLIVSIFNRNIKKNSGYQNGCIKIGLLMQIFREALYSIS